MKDFINQKQVAQNLKKYKFQTFDKEIHEKINKLHHKVFDHQFKHEQKQQKQKQQQGGRVAFPIEYWGSTTNHYSTDVPKFTDITPTQTHLRPAIPLNDPSGVLGTERGMLSGMVGGAKKQNAFQVSKTAHEQSVREFLQEKNETNKSLKLNKKDFVNNSKQKFETVMHKVLSKAAKGDKQHHLSNAAFDKVLEQKQFKAFKA